MTCPACSNPDSIPFYEAPIIAPSVRQCSKCHAVYSVAPISERIRMKIVSPEMQKEDPPDWRLRYFDLDVKTPFGGIRRVHGWYDTETKKIVQVG